MGRRDFAAKQKNKSVAVGNIGPMKEKTAERSNYLGLRF